MLNQVKLVKKASLSLAYTKTADKNNLLALIAKNLAKNKQKIIKANLIDQAKAKHLLNSGELTKPLLERLILNDEKIAQLSNYCEAVANLADPAAKVLSKTMLDDGLVLTKITEPFGVIASIFESRPEVVVQVASLALKSGNGVILKGGSEAKHTNQCLSQIIKESLANYNLADALVLIETRGQVSEILAMEEHIDLIIPRGSNQFVKYIQDNTRIPVMGHSGGVCHVYVAANANLAEALNIVIDSKTDYPSACNAVETLLLDEKIAKDFLAKFLLSPKIRNIKLFADRSASEMITAKGVVVKIIENDWEKEYNDLAISIKLVKGIDEAITHINKHGSKHTDSILTENSKEALKFLNQVDSASVVHNASTRFADGFVFGLGAEVGISTGKYHARGPVGLEGLVTTKWRLVGKGHIKGDYGAAPKKSFKHQNLLT
ncbi:MAG: glutamate-5-semialdehyde dehydrogenase [SAR324 cluster bacterium]|nr:glutamate-5-semialdehyde dehydrogenase [SAR324 cluster bacterium]